MFIELLFATYFQAQLATHVLSGQLLTFEHSYNNNQVLHFQPSSSGCYSKDDSLMRVLVFARKTDDMEIALVKIKSLQESDKYFSELTPAEYSQRYFNINQHLFDVENTMAIFERNKTIRLPILRYQIYSVRFLCNVFLSGTAKYCVPSENICDQIGTFWQNEVLPRIDNEVDGFLISHVLSTLIPFSIVHVIFYNRMLNELSRGYKVLQY